MFRELLSCFDTIDNPRQRNKTEHKLVDILAITVCAVLTHAKSFEDIALYGRKWLRQFLELPGGTSITRYYPAGFHVDRCPAIRRLLLTGKRCVVPSTDDRDYRLCMWLALLPLERSDFGSKSRW